MANCKECKESRSKEIFSDSNAKIPYIVHETAMARNERNIKKLVIALIIAILLIFASNAVWLYAWCQYDYSSETYTEEVIVDSKDGGNANYIGNDGDIINGEDNG